MPALAVDVMCLRRYIAKIAGGAIRVRGLVGEPDGSRILRAENSGPTQDAVAVGIAVAEQLLSQGADQILANVYARAE